MYNLHAALHRPLDLPKKKMELHAERVVHDWAILNMERAIASLNEKRRTSAEGVPQQDGDDVIPQASEMEIEPKEDEASDKNHFLSPTLR